MRSYKSPPFYKGGDLLFCFKEVLKKPLLITTGRWASEVIQQ